MAEFIPPLPDTVRDVIEVIGLLVLIATNRVKILAMARRTRRWNGFGLALRREKWAYIGLFAWLLLQQVIPFFDHWVFLVGVFVWIVITETQVIRMIPHITILHHDEASSM